MVGITEYEVMIRAVSNSAVEVGGKDDGMRKRNGIANGGGRSRMSRHVSQNADVAVVTGGQRHSGGRQSHDQA